MITVRSNHDLAQNRACVRTKVQVDEYCWQVEEAIEGKRGYLIGLDFNIGTTKFKSEPGRSFQSLCNPDAYLKTRSVWELGTSGDVKPLAKSLVQGERWADVSFLYRPHSAAICQRRSFKWQHWCSCKGKTVANTYICTALQPVNSPGMGAERLHWSQAQDNLPRIFYKYLQRGVGIWRAGEEIVI